MYSTRSGNYKIPYVIFHQNWNPNENKDLKNIDKLHHEGIKKIIEDINIINIHEEEKYLFCPSCGFPCTRWPKTKEISTDGKAYLQHQRVSNRPYCNLSEYKGEGERYDTEEKRSKAITSGMLSIVKQWREEEPSEEEWINKEASLYNGTIEDPNGELSNRPINRHVGSDMEKPSTITTLNHITKHIDRFICKDIILPSFSQSEKFAHIFIHVSKANETLIDIERIYWGEVKYVEKIRNYIRIAFGYKTHYIDFYINTKFKKYTTELMGKYIAIAGKLERSHQNSQDNENKLGQSRPCWRVNAEKYGTIGIIRTELVKLLSLPEDINWLDPILTVDEIEKWQGICESNIVGYLLNKGWAIPPYHFSLTELNHPFLPHKITLAKNPNNSNAVPFIKQAIQTIAITENSTTNQVIDIAIPRRIR